MDDLAGSLMLYRKQKDELEDRILQEQTRRVDECFAGADGRPARLVLPDALIINYNTRYSGIKPEMMAPVTRSLHNAVHPLLLHGPKRPADAAFKVLTVPPAPCAIRSAPYLPSWATMPC